jgi:hypothetical protein
LFKHDDLYIFPSGEKIELTKKECLEFIHKISTIEDDTFTDLIKLRGLNLSHNELTAITKNMFGSFKRLCK